MNRVLISDARPSSVQIRQPVDSMSDLLGNIGAVYSKGHAVLSMFEHLIGRETFRKAVINYLNEHAWGNATAQDLWKALDEASGKNVGAALATFTDQPGAPLLSFELSGNRLTVRQRRLANEGVEPPAFTPWQVPFSLKYESGGTVQSTTLLLSDTAETFELSSDGPPQWIYPHAEAVGYYRWAVPAAMLNRLAGQAFDIMSPRERIEFLGNLSALLNAGLVHGDDFLNVLTQFAHDTHPRVISSVIGSLGSIENSFIDKSNRAAFSEYVRRTLRPALDRIGLEPRPGESENITIVRPALLGWLADEGKDREVLEFAEQKFQAYLKSAEAVDPSLTGVIIGLGCMQGDSALFDECRKRFEQAHQPVERSRYLSALGSFRNPRIQQRALAYSLEGPLRPQEVMSIPGGIADESPEKADMIFNWMMEHYDQIVGHLPPMFRGMMTFFASGCSRQRLELAKEFFKQPEHQSPGIGIRLAKVSDQVTDCVRLREREQERVTAYLNRSLSHAQ